MVKFFRVKRTGDAAYRSHRLVSIGVWRARRGVSVEIMTGRRTIEFDLPIRRLALGRWYADRRGEET